MKVTPHVAQNINAHRGPNIDARTTRQARYEISQVIRKRIEEANRLDQTVGGMARTLHPAVVIRRAVDVFNFEPPPTILSGYQSCSPRLNSVRARIEVPSKALVRRREKPLKSTENC